MFNNLSKKLSQALFYYGYSAEDFLTCRGLLAETNYRRIRIITIWSCAVFGLLTIVSFFFPLVRDFFGVYASFALACALIFLSLVKVPYLKKHPALSGYLLLGVLLVFGIISSVPSPQERSVVFPLMLVLLPLVFADHLLRMALFLSSACASFCVLSFHIKTPAIAPYDVYNAVTFTLVALIMHYALQRDSIGNLINTRDTRVLLKKYQAAQKELEIRATFDSMSNLFFRTSFIAEAEHLQYCELKGYKVLGILDLDHFKEINDTHGHQCGDSVIQATARHIIEDFHISHTAAQHYLPKQDRQEHLSNIAGRLGGDEFIFLIVDQPDRNAVLECINTLLDHLNATSIGSLSSIGASIGLVEISASACHFDLLYKNADQALYSAKKSGRNRVCFYESQKA